MAVDADTRIVGRHGAVTLDEASAAVRKLRECTRKELADELGVKPVAVGRFVAGLTERQLIEVDSDERGVFYRARMEPLASEVFEAPEREPEPEPEPEPEAPLEPTPAEMRLYGRVTREEVRDWALMLERFTINHLAHEMEVSWATAKRHVDGLVEQGLIVETAWEGQGGRFYEVRGEVEDHALRHRRRQVPVEREVLAKFGNTIEVERRGISQALGELPKVSNDKDVRILVAEAKAFGWTIETRAKHAVVIPPGAERPIPIPGTPKGAGMVRAFRDQLRSAGLPDLGDPNVQEGPTNRGEVVDDTSRASKRRRADMNVAGRRRPGRRGANRHGKR